jgi:hypothetical protein
MFGAQPFHHGAVVDQSRTEVTFDLTRADLRCVGVGVMKSTSVSLTSSIAPLFIHEM